MASRMLAVKRVACVAAFFFLVSAAAAETLTMGAAAGYKRMLEQILKAYEQTKGQKVDQIYGHIGQIVMQAKTGGSIGIIVGELSFLKSSGLEFAAFKELGQGTLVLAYGKAVKLNSARDLITPEIQKIAMPEAKQAIYGKAASEFLHKSGLFKKIENKIVTVATVPQVSAYLMSKDAEAGFINLTDAIYIKDKIGGWVVVDQSDYTPILLAIGVLKGFENNPEVKAFLDFISANHKAQEILRQAGIE